LNLLRDLAEFSVPAGVTPEDAQVLERMGWALLIVQVLFWGALLYAAHALMRRRNWARIVAIVAIGFVGFSLVWIGGGLLLIGLSDVPQQLRNAHVWYRTLLRLIPALLGIGAWALAYLGWRLISRLRSADVRAVFASGGSGDGA
jgi:hypothetical protein